MASGSRPAGTETPGNNESNLVAEALATIQRRMVDQDARIAEQMEEIRNLREQLNQCNDGGNGGNNDGNPSHMEGGVATHSLVTIRLLVRTQRRFMSRTCLLFKGNLSMRGLGR